MTLGRAAAELAIIVVGVLLALGAQSWWEGRGEEAERADALRALEGDLVPIREVLASDSARVAEIVGSLLRIIRGDDLGVLPDSTLIRTVADVGWHHMGDGAIYYPAYRDLENSGRLGLIPDQVRLDVSAYAEILRRLGSSYDDLVTIQTNLLDPWVVREFEAERIIWRPDAGFAFPGVPDPGPLETREGRNLAAVKYAATVGLQTLIHQQLTRTDALLRALSSTIANP